MASYWKRTFVALSLLFPLAFMVGAAVAPTHASGAKHQYYIGTHGESCSGGCLGEKGFCCEIIVVVEN